MSDSHTHSHFKDKDPLNHVVEVQAKGIIASTESHSPILPGYFSAAIDSAKETAFLLLLLFFGATFYLIPFNQTLFLLLSFSLGWLIWKSGRIAWIYTQHLERLNRIMEQERWEITHHRQQEREELAVLYEAKGFHGKLLEDVLDVLMADDDRLLRVMLEEELSLQLEELHHPLIHSIGSAFGVLIGAALMALSFFFLPLYGVIATATAILVTAAGIESFYQENQMTSAIIWTLGIASLSFSASFFLFKFLIQ